MIVSTVLVIVTVAAAAAGQDVRSIHHCHSPLTTGTANWITENIVALSCPAPHTITIIQAAIGYTLVADRGCPVQVAECSAPFHIPGMVCNGNSQCQLFHQPLPQWESCRLRLQQQGDASREISFLHIEYTCTDDTSLKKEHKCALPTSQGTSLVCPIGNSISLEKFYVGFSKEVQKGCPPNIYGCVLENSVADHACGGQQQCTIDSGTVMRPIQAQSFRWPHCSFNNSTNFVHVQYRCVTDNTAIVRPTLPTTTIVSIDQTTTKTSSTTSTTAMMPTSSTQLPKMVTVGSTSTEAPTKPPEPPTTPPFLLTPRVPQTGSSSSSSSSSTLSTTLIAASVSTTSTIVESPAEPMPTISASPQIIFEITTPDNGTFNAVGPTKALSSRIDISISGGAIAGIVIALILVPLIIVGVVLFMSVRKRSTKKSNSDYDPVYRNGNNNIEDQNSGEYYNTEGNKAQTGNHNQSTASDQLHYENNATKKSVEEMQNTAHSDPENGSNEPSCKSATLLSALNGYSHVYDHVGAGRARPGDLDRQVSVGSTEGDACPAEDHYASIDEQDDNNTATLRYADISRQEDISTQEAPRTSKTKLKHQYSMIKKKTNAPMATLPEHNTDEDTSDYYLNECIKPPVPPRPPHLADGTNDINIVQIHSPNINTGPQTSPYEHIEQDVTNSPVLDSPRIKVGIVQPNIHHPELTSEMADFTDSILANTVFGQEHKSANDINDEEDENLYDDVALDDEQNQQTIPYVEILPDDEHYAEIPADQVTDIQPKQEGPFVELRSNGGPISQLETLSNDGLFMNEGSNDKSLDQEVPIMHFMQENDQTNSKLEDGLVISENDLYLSENDIEDMLDNMSTTV